MPDAQKYKGVLIALEGIDGSGKNTQYNLLSKRLSEAGYDVVCVDFPRYDKASSYFIKQYLDGNYGSLDQVGPYIGSLFYALDRFEASLQIKQALSEGKIVLANRYTGSNMAHQGSKFRNNEQRRGFYIWLDNLEYAMLNIPRPDKNIVLRVPAENSVENINLRASANQKELNIHETSKEHLSATVNVYDELCQLFPRDYQRLDCIRSGKMMSAQTINEMIWQSIEPILPAPNQNQPIQESNPYISKIDDEHIITKAGRDFLDQCLTNTTGDVYTFKDKLSTTTIAAAMARLSRRGDDLRVTLLDEFAHGAQKDEQLLHRVITAYGDDSVQQLVGLHVVVENASNILTKKLEWGRLASYLEQSTRYIYFDRKINGKYQYFVPEYLELEVKQKYISTMDKIFDNYSVMVRKLTDHISQNSSTPKTERDGAWKSAVRAQACDAVRAVLPVSTKATVGIYASGQALESLISHLLSDELPEAHSVGKQLLIEARKIIPAFLERVDINERGVAAQGYRAETYQKVKQLTKELLPDVHSLDYQAVTLTSVWPKNELDIVPDMLYEHSNLSLKEISNYVNNLPYAKKADIFTSYMGERFNRRHRPSRAIEKARYSWDLLCDYGIFRDLQRHRMVDDLEWQALTPRFGYDMDNQIEEAELTEMYEECFDFSAELYSYMQEHNYHLEAQYATLFGHRMRWKITYNAREAFHLHELRTSPQGHPGYRKLVLEMHQKLAEAHPLMADAMRFVNQDEDPELTRLAAERYTQAKLEELDKKQSGHN